MLPHTSDLCSTAALAVLRWSPSPVIIPAVSVLSMIPPPVVSRLPLTSSSLTRCPSLGQSGNKTQCCNHCIFAMLAPLSLQSPQRWWWWSWHAMSSVSPGQPQVWSWHHVTPLTLSWLTTTAQGTQENNQHFLTSKILTVPEKHWSKKVEFKHCWCFLFVWHLMFSESPCCGRRDCWTPLTSPSWPDMTLANFCANCPGRRWEESRCSVCLSLDPSHAILEMTSSSRNQPENPKTGDSRV